MIVLSLPFTQGVSSLDESKVNFYLLKNKEFHFFDYLELRLDYFDKIKDKGLTLKAIENFINNIKSVQYDIKLIFKIRNNNLYINKQIIRELSTKYNALIDIDIAEYEYFSDAVNPDKIILSYHENTESEYSFKNIEEFLEKTTALRYKFLKLALYVNEYEHLFKLRDILTERSEKFFFAGQGNLGKLTRLIYKKLNIYSTYACIAKYETSRYQATLDEMKLVSAPSNKDYFVGGIIGGNQVNTSLGIFYYNNEFRKNKIKAVYLPLPLKEINDFNSLLNFFCSGNSCYGFSVTMPYKKELCAEYLDLPISNLLIPLTKNSYCKKIDFKSKLTDIYGIIMSLKYMDINNNSKVLLYGSGALAELYAQHLAKVKAKYIFSRNEAKVEYFIKKHNFIEYNYDSHKSFDLIINTTPVGSKGEDFVAVTGIKNFDSAIDLPYTTEYITSYNEKGFSFKVKDTNLIEHCQRNNKKFVSGQQFWFWQSREQLLSFKKRINLLS